jgi:hypothetical protein
MVTTKKLLEIYHNIMRDIYDKAQPSEDWDKIQTMPEAHDNSFLDKHYMPKEVFEYIVESHLKKTRVPKWQKQQIKNTVFLGCSPTTNKETWEKYWKEHNNGEE